MGAESYNKLSKMKSALVFTICIAFASPFTVNRKDFSGDGSDYTGTGSAFGGSDYTGTGSDFGGSDYTGTGSGFGGSDYYGYGYEYGSGSDFDGSDFSGSDYYGYGYEYDPGQTLMVLTSVALTIMVM